MVKDKYEKQIDKLLKKYGVKQIQCCRCEKEGIKVICNVFEKKDGFGVKRLILECPNGHKEIYCDR